MEVLLAELAAGFDDPDDVIRVTVRLLAATALGAIIGLQRERVGAAAGLRTHMIVALAATLFVLVPPRVGMSSEDLSRVMQGVATGIGFLGAGAILKLAAERQISGLTTAAGLWMTTAVGMAAGLGAVGIAALAVGLTWIILALFTRVERYITEQQGTPAVIARETSREQ